MNDGTKYIASCSGGKDSVATLILAKQHGDPVDEVVYCEVMFDTDISGEQPEHRKFIYEKVKPFVEDQLGIPFTILKSKTTYFDKLISLEDAYPSRARKCLTVNETPSELKERIMRSGEQISLF